MDSLIQLLAADKAAAGMIGYYAYGAARHISGGWLGGVITGALYPALGMAGQLIVTLILLIICAVVITERSFVGQVQKSGRKVADGPEKMPSAEESTPRWYGKSGRESVPCAWITR